MAGKPYKRRSELQGHRKAPVVEIGRPQREADAVSHLESLTKAALVELAGQHGVSKKGTKAELIERLTPLAMSELPAVADSGLPQLPEPPGGLRQFVHDTWRAMWGSWVATEWDRASVYAPLVAYAWDLNRWLVLYEEVTSRPLVKGSMGQVRENPLAKRLDELTKRLERLEEAYGMNPRARLRMGVEIGDAAEGLQRADDVLNNRGQGGDDYELPDGWELA